MENILSEKVNRAYCSVGLTKTIGINWKFKNKVIATDSFSKIYAQSLEYLKYHDFVGADMAPKYLQMAYTRRAIMLTAKTAERIIPKKIMRSPNLNQVN